MKSNQPNSARQSVHPVAPAASVPISVYRELAAELQATRAMVDALNGKTQQLERENQQLRLEMQRVIHSVLGLQPWVNGLPEPLPAPNRPTWEETAAASTIAANLRAAQEPRQAQTDLEPNQPVPQPKSKPQTTGRLGGLWLVLTILGIIVGAFGAGFLLMRPLLPTVSPESSSPASSEAAPANPAATQPLRPLTPLTSPAHSPQGQP